VLGKHAREGLARELRALIRVEDLRPAVARQGFLQRFDAKEASIVIDARHVKQTNASPRLVSAADAMYALLMKRADKLVSRAENSTEEAEYSRIAGDLHVEALLERGA
jgi:hypothetical protein